MLAGFGLRVCDLGAESFGEDELNKLQTVAEYRKNGLSGKNGEHPFLMKGLQTASVIVAEKIGGISDEAALRFPLVLFGTFSILLIFLLASELFGRSIGIVAAAFWAVEPMAIGFDRIAKEDSLVLFFFLLTHFFWVRAQSRAERGDPKWIRFAWLTAAGFAGLMASKYYPYLLGLIGSYYIIFRHLPRKWDMGKRNWLTFFFVMGVTFLILNPTIVLPETWREMLKFSSEKRIGHDSYEFMGTLYRNQWTAWLSGVPWTFFFVFAWVKSSLAAILLFLVGLPLMFRRKLGDGRFFIFFWAFIWILCFAFGGGKFTRYFAVPAPLIFIVAAVAFCFIVKYLSEKMPVAVRTPLQAALLIAVIAVPLANALSVAPHYRMFTNPLGGGHAAAGTYFPHDEFYDAATRQIVTEIAGRTASPASVACETPELFKYYSGKIGRTDLTFVSLSDREAVSQLKAGDFIVMAKGRRYFSNRAYEEILAKEPPAAEVGVAGIVAATIYQLNERVVNDLASSQ